VPDALEQQTLKFYLIQKEKIKIILVIDWLAVRDEFHYTLSKAGQKLLLSTSVERKDSN